MNAAKVSAELTYLIDSHIPPPYPQILQIVQRLNAPESPFMTFGCEAGELDGYFAGYIEFAFRNSESAQQLQNYQRLFNSFEEWIQKNPQINSHAEAILRSLELRAARIQYPEFAGYKGIKICLVYNGRDRPSAEWLVELFFGWLLDNQQLGDTP